MNKFIKLAPAFALLGVIVISFTGCGLLSTVGSIFQNNTPTDEAPIAESETGAPVIYNEQQFETQYQAIEEPTTTAGNATDVVTKKTNNSNSTTKSTTAKAAEGKKSDVATTKKASGNTTTTKKASTTETTKVDLSNLSVKEIEDLLFSTDDPNVASQIMTIAGFDYDEEQGIFYSQIDPLQRYFGFNLIYDIAAPRTGMIYDTKRIYFTYDDKDWMIQIWKGQYGITAGAEIGLYNKPTDRVVPHYDCASDEDLITMAFKFYNGGKYVFSRGPEKHWWLTGFKVFNVGISFMIDLEITLEFPNRKMSDAFEKGIKNTTIINVADKMTYVRHGNTFEIEW